MYRVLFVCTANICRTPFAKYYLKKRIEQENLQNLIEVLSAGTWAKEGAPAAKFSQIVCKENGMDASSHVSQEIDIQLMKTADVILCMSSEQKRDLAAIFPQFRHKIFLLKEYPLLGTNEFATIPDPFGRKLEKYRIIFEAIKHEIDRIFPILRENAQSKKQISVN